jgi:hypothetical protein
LPSPPSTPSLATATSRRASPSSFSWCFQPSQGRPNFLATVTVSTSGRRRFLTIPAIVDLLRHRRPQVEHAGEVAHPLDTLSPLVASFLPFSPWCRPSPPQLLVAGVPSVAPR